MINIVPKLPREGAQHELLRRLASMGQQPQVKEAVEDLLGTDGLFRCITLSLTRDFGVKRSAILSSALPDSAIAVLERLIEKASRAELSDFKSGTPSPQCRLGDRVALAVADHFVDSGSLPHVLGTVGE